VAHRSTVGRRWVLRRNSIFLIVFATIGSGVCWLVASQRPGPKAKDPGRPATTASRSQRVRELLNVGDAHSHSGSMVFSSDGKILALPKHADGRVELLRLDSGRADVLVSAMNPGQSAADWVAFSSDGRFLAVYYQHVGVAVWNVNANSELAHIPVNPPSYVFDMAFVKGSRTIVALIASASLTDPKGNLRPKYAVRWASSTGEKQGTQTFETCRNFIGISHDGRYTILEDAEGTAVFELTTGKKAFVVDNDSCGFRFSEDSSTLVAYSGRQIRVVEVPSGRESKRIAFEASFLVPGYGVVDRLGLSPDAKLLAIGWFGQPNLVGIVSLVSGKVVDTFECCPPSMFCDTVLFSPDGRMLVTDTKRYNMNDAYVEPLLKFWQIPASW
jgi:WD40 repeat protein